MQKRTIKFEGEIFDRVGCRKCESASQWYIFYNGKIHVAMCAVCGRLVKIDQNTVTTKPDNKAIYMRMLI